MTPEELCRYIIDGDIFEEIRAGDADFSELGRYIWPQRYAVLVTLAKDAVLTSAVSDNKGRCKCEEIGVHNGMCGLCGKIL